MTVPDPFKARMMVWSDFYPPCVGGGGSQPSLKEYLCWVKVDYFETWSGIRLGSINKPFQTALTMLKSPKLVQKYVGHCCY